jgi:hypothetical protein
MLTQQQFEQFLRNELNVVQADDMRLGNTMRFLGRKADGRIIMESVHHSTPALNSVHPLHYEDSYIKEKFYPAPVLYRTYVKQEDLWLPTDSKMVPVDGYSILEGVLIIP